MDLHYFPIAILIVLLISSCADTDADSGHLEWQDDGGYRWAELKVPSGGEPGFEPLDSSQTGISFMNTLTEVQIVDNRVLLNGSGVALGDVTGNGFTDIYFCRLDGPNVLYKNLGNFQFEDITDYAGIGLPDQFSTGAVFADLNGNGYLDLIVTSIDSQNRIFFNDGSGKFTERVNALETDRNYGSTSIAVADINGNGALDIYITNYKERSVRDIYPYEDQFRFIIERVDGEYRVTEKFRDHYSIDIRDSILVWVETGEPDLLYLNDGSGTFTRGSLTSGVFRDENGYPITEDLLDWGLHAKFHDITGNGYPDLYVCNDFETPDRIWLNNGDGTFRLIPRTAIRKTSVSSMAVDFSDINRNGFTDIFVIEMLSREHSKRMRQMGTTAPSPQPPGAIENRPQYLGNVLQLNRGDNTFAEIAEYSSVRRSDWSWGTLFLDVDLNGYEDILITTGHHYDVQDFDANNLIRNRLAMGVLDPTRSMLYYPKLEEQNVIFRNKGNLQFEDVSGEWGFTGFDVSHGIAMGDMNNNGSLDIVVNKLGYTAGIYRNKTDAVKIFSHRNGVFELVDSLTGDNSCTGPVALGDYSGNGYPDLFVGGRVIPGRYPEPASSRLYTNTGDSFIIDEENTRILQDIGLVNGALFSDLDGDGIPELILAIRWGPVKIFKVQNGKLVDMTGEYGLDKYIGWWNGVTTGDINGNGRPDIIATNWGLNHPYHIVDGYPVQIYYDDFTGDGTIDIIETYYDPYMKEFVPRRGYSITGESLPVIREHIQTYARYAESGVQEIFRERLDNTREVQATTFEHKIFFNQGDRFEAASLPQKAQLAPAFAVAVADLNGNGYEDVFVSQNFFAYHLETPRSDAGRGLWLRGDGTGNLEPVPGHISGIQVYGEQRGAALADFDNDGRVDIAISQNAAATVLYKNTGAQPGLRARLDGRDENPSAIGAVMRVVYENEMGPARTIHAGSGYLSHNSVTQVLGLRDEPKAILIRWPDGSETTSDIPPGVRDIVVRFDGSLTVNRTDVADIPIID